MESSQIYDDAHVRICGILGRVHNNPLGDDASELLRRLLFKRRQPDVLDSGCGRGASAIWWARTGHGAVEAFDPSESMLEEARNAAREAGVSNLISFKQCDIAGFEPTCGAARRYDVIVAHDVLCYSTNRENDIARLVHLLKKNGVLSVSDYFCDIRSARVERVIDSWKINMPATYAERKQELDIPGFKLLGCFDTSRQYRDHWLTIQNRLDQKWFEVVAAAGQEHALEFSRQIQSILNAVEGGGFGHFWALLTPDIREP